MADEQAINHVVHECLCVGYFCHVVFIRLTDHDPVSGLCSNMLNSSKHGRKECGFQVGYDDAQ